MSGAVQTWDWRAPPPPRGWLDAFGERPAVWLARVPSAPAELEALAVDLSADERGRADAFRWPGDRARAIAGRALARRLLGAHLGVAPAALEIVASAAGKPALAAPAPAPEFNLSHSGELVLAAFHPSRGVGVDVEQVRLHDDWSDVSGQVFSREAHAAWLRLPPERRAPEFFRAWTRHEALLKAWGVGFASSPESARAASGAKIDELDLPAGYAGACAWVVDAG